MGGDDNSEWVFDSLVGFLRGPVWHVPILTFIEEKSLIFEPEGGPEEEYAKVHEQYRNLVDYMLGSFMEDLGITPEQFEEACEKASQPVTAKVHQSLFEQVWAADDQEIFRRMMAQKNIELQLQALDILQQRYGITPQAFLPGDDPLPDDEARIMEEVIRRSLEEQSRPDEELEKAMAESSETERHRLESVHKSEKVRMEEAVRMSLKTADPEKAEEETEGEPEEVVEEEAKEEEEEAVVLPEAESSNSATDDIRAETKPKGDIDPEELRRRQEYLRGQRDKLLALKRAARAAALEEANPRGGSSSRPKSARAAKSALDQSQEPHAGLDPKTLQARRALAERLKAEVVGNL